MKNIKIFSVLVHENKPVGVRFMEDVTYFDIELSRFKGEKLSLLKGVRQEKLVDHNGLLITRMERDGNSLVDDYSNNAEYVSYILQNVLNQKPASTVSKANSKPKLKDFKVVVFIKTFHPIELRTVGTKLTGDFIAKDSADAAKRAKEFFALEHGTDISKVGIISVEEIENVKQ